MKKLRKTELLAMTPSITAWILLLDAITSCPDIDYYKKLVKDYHNSCPLYMLERLMENARQELTEQDFAELLNFLFDQHHFPNDNTHQQPK